MIRVTDVLDYFTEPELLRWIENNSKAKRKAISDEALSIGSLIDLLVQKDIRGEKDIPIIPPQIKFKVDNCINAWKLYKAEHPETVNFVSGIQAELIWMDIMGHPDLILEGFSGKESWGIIDVKTSSSIRPKYWTQCAAYSWLKQKMTGWALPEFIGILRLDKLSGLYEYKENRDSSYIMYEQAMFLHYLECYKHGEATREMMRQQLEKEILECSTK